MNCSILLTDNHRSKAYLQNLVRIGKAPVHAILLQGSKTNSESKIVTPQLLGIESLGISFDVNESVTATLANNGIPYSGFDTMDPNRDDVVEEVAKTPADYIVFSGPGGCILRKKILTQGKQFIHIHPGWLPTYRGSTTVYYSMLTDCSLACSTIILAPKIDCGPILYRRRFEILDPDVDLDYVLDPCLRTATLLDFMMDSDTYLTNPVDQSLETGHTFYITHPIVKHFAILHREKLLGKR